jgi:hypothetical protein
MGRAKKKKKAGGRGGNFYSRGVFFVIGLLLFYFPIETDLWIAICSCQ